MAAAFTEFTRRGFGAARVSVIARRAGVSLATLQQYFPSKDELFREVVRTTIITQLPGRSEPEGATAPDRPAVDRLRMFVRQFWRAMEQPEQAALLRLSVGELPGFPELAVFHTTEVIGRAVTRLEGILADGSDTGELRIPDSRTTARVIQSALITYALWFASPGIYGGLTGHDRERAEDAVIEVLVGALGGAAA